MSRFITSEAVTEGHPDKVCDVVSDSILDAYLTLNPDSRVAVETSAKDGLVVVEGEVSAPSVLDHVQIARDAIASIGYTDADSGIDPYGAGVINNIRPRSFDSDQVEGYGNLNDAAGLSKEEAYEKFGSDQGLVVGYASDDTKVLLPLPIYAANRLAERLAYVRKNGILPFLRPDGKTLVTVQYRDDLLDPVAIAHVLISTQHNASVAVEDVREQVRAEVLEPVLGALDIDSSDATVIINKEPFVSGGPKADAGVTGRKIIVDTYGGIAGHGGGAFSGKDPRKADRSAAYAARWVAKNVVAAGLARRAQVQIGYSYATASPVSLDIETFGTETADRERIQHAVEQTFDLRLLAIIDRLNLRRPIYTKTAAYGHFGREEADFTWEKTDRVEELQHNL
jgi:S-adenosylmethionine synthetase